MTQKVVVNRGYGGFSVSDNVVRWMRENGYERAQELTLPGEEYDDGSKRDKDGIIDCCYPRESWIRTYTGLIDAVEEHITTDLSVVEVPDGVEWVITEYDGAETLRERHRVFPSGEYAEGIANSEEINES